MLRLVDVIDGSLEPPNARTVYNLWKPKVQRCEHIDAHWSLEATAAAVSWLGDVLQPPLLHSSTNRSLAAFARRAPCEWREA